MMTEANIDSFARTAADIAMRAAAEYLRQRSVKLDDAGYVAVVAALRRHVKASLSEALDDAKQAFECGMTQAAETTFRLSMAQAGLAAAKEYVAA